MPTGLVGVGADLEPGTLLAAYRSGLFPMPVGRRDIGWWSPDPRGVLPLDGLHVSRSLRQSCRAYDVRVEHALHRRDGRLRRPARGRTAGSTATFVDAYGAPARPRLGAQRRDVPTAASSSAGCTGSASAVSSPARACSTARPTRRRSRSSRSSTPARRGRDAARRAVDHAPPALARRRRHPARRVPAPPRRRRRVDAPRRARRSSPAALLRSDRRARAATGTPPCEARHRRSQLLPVRASLVVRRRHVRGVDLPRARTRPPTDVRRRRRPRSTLEPATVAELLERARAGVLRDAERRRVLDRASSSGELPSMAADEPRATASNGRSTPVGARRRRRARGRRRRARRRPAGRLGAGRERAVSLPGGATGRRAAYVGRQRLRSDRGARCRARPHRARDRAHARPAALGRPDRDGRRRRALYTSALDLMSDSAAPRDVDPARRDGPAMLAADLLALGWVARRRRSPSSTRRPSSSCSPERPTAPPGRVAVVPLDDDRLLTVELLVPTGSTTTCRRPGSPSTSSTSRPRCAVDTDARPCTGIERRQIVLGSAAPHTDLLDDRRACSTPRAGASMVDRPRRGRPDTPRWRSDLPRGNTGPDAWGT